MPSRPGAEKVSVRRLRIYGYGRKGVIGPGRYAAIVDLAEIRLRLTNENASALFGAARSVRRLSLGGGYLDFVKAGVAIDDDRPDPGGDEQADDGYAEPGEVTVQRADVIPKRTF